MIPQVATIKLLLRHASQYHDDETGLFHNWHRYYDPKTGRNVTSDPIGLYGGMNNYGYVGASPLGCVDPTGEFFFIPAIQAAVGTAVVAISAGVACDITNVVKEWQTLSIRQQNQLVMFLPNSLSI